MTEAPAPAPSVKRRPRWMTPLIAAVALVVGVMVGGSGNSGASPAGSVGAAPAETVTVTAPAAPGPVTTVTVAAKPAVPAGSITADGVYLVGSDIKAGTYKTAGGDTCYWARLSDLSGNGIINNGVGSGQQVVTVSASDKAFETRGCGVWSRVS